MKDSTIATILEEPQFKAATTEGASIESLTGQEQLPTAPSEQAASFVRNLPVKLCMTIGDFKLPLRELSALAPGAVLEAPSRGQDLQVDIMADCVRIAVGRLVALGPGYGVIIEHVEGI